MGGFYSSPEANSSLEVGNMGASGSKENPGATAPHMKGMNGMNKNVELGINNPRVNTRVNTNTNASDPGTPGANNTRRNNKSRKNIAINVNSLRGVVVDKPSQPTAGEGPVGNKQAGGRRRKGSRKAHRRGHKSRRR
jgi:hypothetical protein